MNFVSWCNSMRFITALKVLLKGFCTSCRKSQDPYLPQHFWNHSEITHTHAHTIGEVRDCQTLLYTQKCTRYNHTFKASHVIHNIHQTCSETLQSIIEIAILIKLRAFLTSGRPHGMQLHVMAYLESSGRKNYLSILYWPCSVLKLVNSP